MSEHRLHELTIERPRGGMRLSSRRLKGVRKTLDRLTDVASEDGLLSPYFIKVRGKTKHFSDHLAPLRQFLYSQLGQPWDRIYSELCQSLDSSTLSGQHILSHLWDYVERYVEIVDGIPCRKSSTYRGRELGKWRYYQFYIHPDTGVLCLAERIPKAPPKPVDDFIKLDAYHHYRRVDGIWYHMTVANLPSFGCFWDVMLKEFVSRERGKSTYIIQKRQCNKKEVRWILAKLNGDVAQRIEHHSSKVTRAGSSPAIPALSKFYGI